MAKQLVNPIERHVEKAVLALAVLAFLFAVAKFLVTTPNKVELGMKMVSPGDIDVEIWRQAQDVRAAVARKRSTVEIPEKLYGELERRLDPWSAGLLPRDLPVTVRIGPDVPVVDTAIPSGAKELVDVLVPESLHITQGRTTFFIEDPVAEGFPSSRLLTDWVTVSALMDRKRQAELQIKEYDRRYEDVLFGAMELQRRSQRVDGSWSDDDWSDVSCWPSFMPKTIPEIPLAEQNEQIVATSETRLVVNNIVGLVNDPAEQLKIIRPLLPPWINGTEWRFPEITTEKDVYDQDAEYLRTGLSLGDATCRYPWCAVDEDSDTTVEVSAQDRIKALLAQAEMYMERGDRNCDLDDANRAYNIYFDCQQGKVEPWTAATAADKRRCQEGAELADSLGIDIKRRCPDGPTNIETDKVDKNTTPLLPKQQLWVHDARPGSLKPGVTVQYRARFTIYNQYAGNPGPFKDPWNATVPFVKGDWSEPSEAIRIEPYSYCYVTDRSDDRGTSVRIEIFQWTDGVWVSDEFAFEVGDRLYREHRTLIPRPDNPNESGRGTVKYDGGVWVADIDFDTKLRDRERPSKRNPDAVQFRDKLGSEMPSVVFMDDDGVLHERFSASDAFDPQRDEMGERRYDPRRRNR